MRAFEQRKKGSTTSSSFFGPKVQKKLKTGTVGDKYEVEADKVADKVVNNSSGGGLLQSKNEEEVQKKPISETISTVQSKEMKDEDPVQKKADEKEEPIQKKEEEKEPVQKKEEEEEKPVQKKEKEEEPIQKKEEEKELVQKKEEEEKPVQAKCDDCEKEDKVQKKGKEEEEKSVQTKSNSSETKSQNNTVESKLDSSKGNGTTMDKTTKQEMEAGFGTDFSNVNIHTDSTAVQMSQELGAQAFTRGNDVYFNKGKYNPDSKEGKHLLAHELTHTVQQTGVVQKSETVQKSAINANENHPENLRAENPEFINDYYLEKANDDESYITNGCKGNYVSKLQNGLMDLGYQLPKFGADGDFGSETRNAVVNFQSDNFLQTDGVVGPETMGTLDNILVEKKGGKKESCASEVPFNKTFTNQESIGFFSTKECPNVLINIKAVSFMSNFSFCDQLNISIDNVKSTRRTIKIGLNQQGSFNGTFKLKNHKGMHKLIFEAPSTCKDFGGNKFNVTGTIKRF
jgi:hypothetical protein